jgi:hypothetical protein
LEAGGFDTTHTIDGHLSIQWSEMHQPEVCDGAGEGAGLARLQQCFLTKVQYKFDSTLIRGGTPHVLPQEPSTV